MSRKEYYINNKDKIKEYQKHYTDTHKIQQKIYNSCYCSVLKKHGFYNRDDRHTNKYKLLKGAILREVRNLYIEQMLIYKQKKNEDNEKKTNDNLNCKKINNLEKNVNDEENIILEFM